MASDFDLRSTTLRIVECTRCDEIVAGEAMGLRVELHCGYCGFDDVRELAAARAADEGASAYRGKKAREGKRVELAFDAPLPPNTRLATRGLWLEAKKTLGSASDDGRGDAEFRLMWLGGQLAGASIDKREYLRARATLETMLESVTTP